MSGRKKIGLMRLEIEDDRVLVGTNVNPAYRGMGVGSKIMGLTTRRVFEELGKSIVAEIRSDNIASIKMCAKNGYVIERQEKNITYMRYKEDR
jgi:RimJ/RimL family protein N-acetyltransferase